MKRLIITADDFGLDEAVNAAVEQAHREGVLSAASLMVGAPAAADAVRRARRLPGLKVGLHLVLVDGVALSPAAEIAGLAGAGGALGKNLFLAGLRFFLLPEVRRALAKEIRAQFAAFRATGLALDHVNAHKHIHLHPTIARLVIAIGGEFGLRAIRIPEEPVSVLSRAFPEERYRQPFYALWASRLRARAGGLLTNDHLFGLAWSGAMVEERLLRLLPHLPPGTSEIYFHPAVARSPAFERAMPLYRPREELEALISPRVARRIAELGISLSGYGDLAADARPSALRPGASGPTVAAQDQAAKGG